MAEKNPQNMERRRARLVADDVGLELGHGPHVVHHVSDDDHVGALSTMESHVSLRFLFFIVSKERVIKNYSNAKGRYA
jgi:hypothetical protein